MNFVYINLTKKLKVLLSLLLVVVGCNSVRNPPDIGKVTEVMPNSTAEPDLQTSIQKPMGTELTLKVKVIGSKRAVITVSNISDSNVYISYIPGGKDKFAIYAILDYEKLNPVSRQFQSWGGGDLGTGLHALPAHDLFKDQFQVPEKGTYRVRVRYIVDDKLAERINNLARLSDADRAVEEDKLAKMRERSTKTLTSEPFDL